MVLPFYQLREQPFGGTPDSRFFFLSNTHREALASLLFGVDAGCGFLAVISAPGLGKTTLLLNA
jgi:general secretion pathway protein A